MHAKPLLVKTKLHGMALQSITMSYNLDRHAYACMHACTVSDRDLSRFRVDEFA